FIIVEDEPHLLEINPRPGASLDILDDAAGTLFRAHVEAFSGDQAVDRLTRNWRPHPQAAAYVYADAGDLLVPAVRWPDWVSDRPPAGRTIPSHSPVLTVQASAENPETAEQVCRARASEMAGMIYQQYGNQEDRPDDSK